MAYPFQSSPRSPQASATRLRTEESHSVGRQVKPSVSAPDGPPSFHPCPLCGNNTPPHVGIHIDPDRMLLIVDGRSIELRPSFFEIVSILIEKRGAVVRFETIHDRLYGLDPNGGPDVGIIKVFVCQIRKLLKETRASIKTKWGMGYYLEMLPSEVVQ